ncbi:MAG TPA: hypothetical protein VI731_09520 [Bacteroidia bacterium]|nr:hypothetical protein [Bacteroidia bacterium]
MKKLFAVASVVGMVALSSCGDAGKASQEYLDSMMQDSIMRAENEMRRTDSLRTDSINKDMAAKEAARVADSARKADSAAAATPKKNK